MTNAYQFRAATVEDIEPMMAIGHEGLRPHAEKVRAWHQAEEEAGFLAHFEIDKVRIVQVAGESVGYIKIEDMGDHSYLEGIYLSAEHRGQGLGTSILGDLIATTTKPLRLHVYVTNPAKRLYSRLGFVVLEEDEQRLLMEINSKS